MKEYWLTFIILPDGTAGRRLMDLKNAVSNLSTLWKLESASFIRFCSREEHAVIADAIKAALDPAKDTMLLGTPETAVTLLATAANDDDYQDMLASFEQRRRQRRTHRRSPPLDC